MCGRGQPPRPSLPVPRSELGADAAAGAQEENWVPSITVKQILLAIQHLLDTPNPNSPAQGEAYNIYMNKRSEYKRRVKAQARQFPPP